MTVEEITNVLSLDKECLDIFLNMQKLVLRALIISNFDLMQSKKLNGLESMSIDGYQTKIRRDFFVDSNKLHLLCKQMKLI